MTDIFTAIFQGLVEGFGYSWVAWVILLIAFLAVVLILIDVDLLTATAVMAFPVLLLILYQIVSMPSWVLGSVVLVVGFVFGLSVYRLFVK